MRGFWRSFAGGEITPELYGRLDLSKYQTGLTKCLNARTLPHGPATRRTGFQFIGRVKDSTNPVRLIPFSFAANQTLILEFGHQYVRFYSNGSAVLEANVAISGISGNTVTATGHGYSVGDEVYIGGRFWLVSQIVDANNFKVTDLWGVAPASLVGSTSARVYTLSTPYQGSDLFALRYAQNSDVLTITHPSYAARELNRLGAASWTLTSVSFAPTITAPTGLTLTVNQPTAGNAINYSYVVTAIASDGVTESLASGEQTAACALGLQGNYIAVSWTAVSGAIRYNVYKRRGGLYGFIGQTTTNTITDDNILPDTLKTPPQSLYTLNGGANDYPTAVGYHEQRRWFAGSNNNPQVVWATRSATESNLTSSVPSQDDDALQFRIAARQQNAIQHLVELNDMLAMTVGGEFRIFSENSPVITPTTLTVKPQGFTGASNVTPVQTNNSVLYVQAQGARVREMAYTFQTASFNSTDVSIMAPHLFDGYTLVDMAYSRAPIPTLWCVRSDGFLLGLTYVPDQQVYGWHQHTAGGSGVFESVAVVSEGYEDVLYAVVRRTINGQSVRYVERMHSRIFTAQPDAFFVDSGLTYTGASTTTISGLYHLEGKTVQIYGNGAVLPTAVVSNGSITLASAVTEAQIGLQYVTQIETLPIAIPGDPAFGEGLTKNVNKVAVRVTQSNLVAAGPSFTKLTAFPARAVTDNYGSAPALRTAELRFTLTPQWNSDGTICFQQDQPVPLTLVSVALDTAIGG